MLPLFSAACLISAGGNARASTAYGTLNNFDCVNDTGVEAHGFDIELEDMHSKDITYTYDYNHYGVPKITEDTTSVPGHTNVLVRYSGVKSNGVWSAYSAVPSGPIAPTMGHQFTNPGTNFGGEHFGVGYYGAPSAVKNNWLIDDGTGNLVHGPPVNVSTPTFTYNPPAGGVPANVVAVVVPPPPPVPPPLQFGDASWVKEIKTTTHNTNKVELVNLVGDDPGQPQPWANGEPSEVEVEWKILQTEFAATNGGANGELQGAPEDLPGGDEVITRRYEFYKYTGPIDVETGQAMADVVAADGIHGTGTVTYVASFDVSGNPVTVTADLSTNVVVGDFFGAQMSGFDVAPKLGLIDHLQDGELNVPYPDRTVVVGGGAGFLAAVQSGSLPDGLTLDGVTGVLSGTPTNAGAFTFAIEASDTTGANLTNTYTVTIAGGIVVVPVTFTIATSASPGASGITSGDGTYNSNSLVTVIATPSAGYAFVNWTEGGATVSLSTSFQFSVTANRSLVAQFTPITYTVATSASPVAGGTTSGGGSFNSGANVTVVATPNAGYTFVNWTEGGVAVSASSSYQFSAAANRSLVAHFTPITYTVSTSASPSAGGTTSGDGTYNSNSLVTVTASPNPGYAFVNWTENGVAVSASSSYQFTASANRSLVAQFTPITCTVSTSASPVAGGATSGGGSFNSGANVTVVATPNAGYAFVNWTEGGVQVSTSASYGFSAGANRSLVAHFRALYTVTATPNKLWPPNHKLVPITIRLVSVDRSLHGKIISVTMNEPVDRRQQDWVITGDLKLRLRAENNRRDGERVYTITVQCTDASGYTSTATTTVTVPRNHSWWDFN